jgi:nucleotide-binding universal stress UspA family protein
MTYPALPTRVFMATDLSARCDRALARAVQLSRDWHAELTVAHVVGAAEVARHDNLTQGSPSWRRPQSWTRTLEQMLSADLEAERIGAASTVIVGAPSEAVERAARDDGAELVVLGIAKDAPMDRIQLGSTVDALVRHSQVPVLNVRRRVRGPYHHVVVATDFSEPALQALRLAARWFDGARLTLFHAYPPPGAGLPTDPAADHSRRALVEQECSTHLAASQVPEATLNGMQRILEPGAPEALLADYIASAEVDLVILGSQGRSGLARAMLGSTAERLLHSLDCDTIVVRRD